MNGIAVASAVKMWLVDDEVIILDYKGEDEAFRLRIWRHKERPAVVLVSREPGFINPCKVSSRMANLAYKSYLAYDKGGLHFLEWDGKRLRAVNFIGWGSDDRLFLVRPEYREIDSTELDDLVGCHVDL